MQRPVPLAVVVAATAAHKLTDRLAGEATTCEMHSPKTYLNLFMFDNMLVGIFRVHPGIVSIFGLFLHHQICECNSTVCCRLPSASEHFSAGNLLLLLCVPQSRASSCTIYFCFILSKQAPHEYFRFAVRESIPKTYTSPGGTDSLKHNSPASHG